MKKHSSPRPKIKKQESNLFTIIIFLALFIAMLSSCSKQQPEYADVLYTCSITITKGYCYYSGDLGNGHTNKPITITGKFHPGKLITVTLQPDGPDKHVSYHFDCGCKYSIYDSSKIGDIVIKYQY